VSSEPDSSHRALLLAAAAVVSLVLSGLLLLARPWGVGHGLGLVLGAVTLLAALQAWRTGDRRFGVGVLVVLSLQLGVFLGTAGGAPSLARFRLVQAAAILACAAILVVELLVRIGNVAPKRAALLAFAAALGILGGDTILGLGAPPNRVPARGNWPDSADVHPRLGRVPRPYAAITTYYPDDRGGYLLEEDLRAKSWELRVMPGSVAELVLPPEDPELLRVAIEKANADTTWHVQLAHSRFVVRAQDPYFITFRARADRARKVGIGFSQNHPPWRTLGLYLDIELTPQWKEFREVFTSRTADTNTAIMFNLAGSNISVEVAAVTLHGPPAGQRVDPVLSNPRFFIRHQRNALGCRDQDYTATPPPPTVRILALGDGFTSGVGVHEKDTFASLIERDLHEPTPAQPRAARYEMINCGVSGYGTREQRLFYDSFGATYRPDVVLVTMGWDDDRFYWEERQRALIKRGPGRPARISSVLRKIEVSRRLRRTYDYSRSVEDLLALHQAVRAHGARLVVAVSRHGPAGLGDALLETVRKGLAGSGVPLLDLGIPGSSDPARGDPRDPPGPEAHRTAALALLGWLRKDILPGLPQTASVP
jgi:hypothetical protein